MCPYEFLNFSGISTKVAAGTILRRAALPMGTVDKTLDAIHLGAAMLFGERRGARPIFATHDRQQAAAARALGFQIIGR